MTISIRRYFLGVLFFVLLLGLFFTILPKTSYGFSAQIGGKTCSGSDSSCGSCSCSSPGCNGTQICNGTFEGVFPRQTCSVSQSCNVTENINTCKYDTNCQPSDGANLVNCNGQLTCSVQRGGSGGCWDCAMPQRYWCDLGAHVCRADNYDGVGNFDTLSGCQASGCENIAPTSTPLPGVTASPTPVGCFYCGQYTDSGACASGYTQTCQSRTSTGDCSQLSWGGSCSSSCTSCQLISGGGSAPQPTAQNTPTPTPCYKGGFQGTVCNDANSNGLYDSGEGVIPGVTVELQEYDNFSGTPNWTQDTTTDSSGWYSFNNISVDPNITFKLRAYPLSGYKVTTNNGDALTPSFNSCGQTISNNICMVQPPTPTPIPPKTCSISGARSYIDLNQSMALSVSYSGGWSGNDKMHNIMNWYEINPFTGQPRAGAGNECSSTNALGIFSDQCDSRRGTDSPSTPQNLNVTWTALTSGITQIEGHPHIEYSGGTCDVCEAIASASNAYCKTPIIFVAVPPTTPTPTSQPTNVIQGRIQLQDGTPWKDQVNQARIDVYGSNPPNFHTFGYNNSNGNFRFALLFGGNYTVTFTPANGYTAIQSVPVVCNPAGCTTATPTTARFSIPPSPMTLVFTMEQLSCIDGYIYYDNGPGLLSYNGVRDLPSELGIPLVKVDANGPSPDTTTSNGAGYYAFNMDLVPGSYTLALSNLPSGFSQTTASAPIVIQPGICSQVDIGFNRTYTVEGDVFVDDDQNTVKNGGESNYNGAITITVNPQDGVSSIPAYGPSGHYKIPGVFPNQPHTITYTSLPSGFYFTWPIPPPSYSINVGPGCSVPDATHDAKCDAQGNITNLNFGIANEAPWFQGVEGDMRLDNGFQDYVPDGKYANLVGPGNYHGVIFSGEKSYTFGIGGPWQERASRDRWVAGGTSESEKEKFSPVNSGIIRTSYGYLLQKAQQSGAEFTPAPDSCRDSVNGCTFSNRNGLFQATGASDYYLNTTTFDAGINKSAVILVDGNLHIIGEIHVTPGSTLTISASGDIIVDKLVGVLLSSSSNPNLEGFFSADKNFKIDGYNDCVNGPADKRLNIQGVVIANAGLNGSSVQNNRNLCAGNQNPSYYIEQRLDMILNAPQFLKHSNYSWREVAP